jgi:hypothetical protein
MPALDVFKADAFNVLSLSTALNKMPYVPKRLGELGLFKKQGITTTTVMVEERRGKLMIVPNVARGSSPNPQGGRVRQARTFTICHLPLAANVMADDVQNIRSFGNESEIESVADIVNDKLSDMRQNFEATHEFHRAGAIQGLLKDADGTTIYDWFAEFGITATPKDIAWAAGDLTAATSKVKLTCNAARRAIEDALGNDTYTGIRCIASRQYIDAITSSLECKEAYKFQQSQFLRDSQVRSEFQYAGVTFEEYRGDVPVSGSSTPFIADNTAWYFPEGTQNIFVENYGPANFIETVNTKGLPTYAKQERMKFDMGIEIFGQSNPLIMCCRPAVLIQSTMTGTAPSMFGVSLGSFGPDGPSDLDLDNLKKNADETHKVAEHTKDPRDKQAADDAKRDLSVAKLDREETDKRKKQEEHAKAEEAKRLEHEKAEAIKEQEKAEKEHKK